MPNRHAALIHQINRLKHNSAINRATSSLYSWARLWTFLGLLAGIFGGVFINPAGWLWAGFTFLGFMVAVIAHRSAEHTLKQKRLYLRIKQTHRARMKLDWTNIPLPPLHTAIVDHPFEIDLDISGERSLHHLLDTAVSMGGSNRLRGWLLAIRPDPAAIARRRDVVNELIRLTTFRDKLTLSSKLTARNERHWDDAKLRKWLESPAPDDGLGRTVAILGGIAIITLTLAMLHAAAILPPIWAFSFLAYFALSLTRIRDFTSLFGEALSLQNALAGLVDVFSFLENYRYGTNIHLRGICAPFLTPDRPSTRLRRVTRVVSAASIQANIILWALLNAALPWDLFFAWQLRRQRVALAGLLPAWLDTWYELEALSSLATFAYLNPDETTFPEIVTDATIWEARALGHPLIPAAVRISNDFSIHPGEVALITGSNMSGKSSFLRAVGVNMVLAYAGSVVLAESLRISPYRPFTCIRVSDSLADGFSYFYAEVRRLKALLDALESTDSYPLFFLIDEIFRGTNNRERLIGSRAYIQRLATSGRSGTGLISTHDLELTALAGGNILNYHFTDRVEDGRMTFDYVLHSGPSPSTNALAIMRLAGLPVGEPS